MKICLGFSETRIYRHNIIVEFTSEEDIGIICTHIEKKGVETLDDYVYELKKQGVKVLGVCEDNGETDEFECNDIYILENNNGGKWYGKF